MSEKRRPYIDFNPEDPDSAWEGPAAENAYPEDHMIEIDGKLRPANEAARYYNRVFGDADPAAEWQDKREKKDSEEETRPG